jgi:hypothetical protein
MPTLPLPRQFGQVLRPALSARVVGALGLAPKGSSLGTLPLPLQTGHLDIISIAAYQNRFIVWLDYILFANQWHIRFLCFLYRFEVKNNRVYLIDILLHEKDTLGRIKYQPYYVLQSPLNRVSESVFYKKNLQRLWPVFEGDGRVVKKLAPD